tara:strand:+ start:638 stop:1384 length:747 start_codon:yes stop_codon:yes gene_type:complete
MKKNLLVTGSSGGIGKAVSILASKSNYNICLHFNKDKKGVNECEKECNKNGADTIIVQGDLSNPEEVKKVFQNYDDNFDHLDGLVNNAGIVDVSSRLDNMSYSRISRMINVNLIGSMLVAKEAVIRMSTLYGKKGGNIVNVSSAAAKIGSAGQYIDYAVSKAGLDIFTKGLAEEVATENIRVNGVRPGIIETEIHAKGGIPNRAQLMAPKVPMKRSGTPDEVANVIMFLLSEDCSYVTGSTLDVSGGR